MANIQAFIERLTKDETKETLKEALNALPDEDAIEAVREWLEERGLNPNILDYEGNPE